MWMIVCFFFFSSRRRHTRCGRDWSSDVCSSDLVSEPEELAARARLVVEAASWFPGRRDDFAVALGVETELAGLLPDWLVGLVGDLGRAGLGTEAAMVGDALARVNPDLQALLDGDIAVALAEAGLAEQARARIESNLTRWPDDFW